MAVDVTDTKLKSSDSEWELLHLLDNKQTVQSSDEVDVRNSLAVTLFVFGNSPAVSGGVVVLESSPISGYTGTWKQVGSITLVNGTTMYAVSASLGTDGYPAFYMRARISTQIANGNIDAYLALQR